MGVFFLFEERDHHDERDLAPSGAKLIMMIHHENHDELMMTHDEAHPQT